MLGEGTEMVLFRFLHRATFQTIAFFALTAAQAAEIFELSQDAWTWDRTANEREMKLSLDMSRRSLKMVRQETYPGRHV
jgi:hypothetical protein